MPEGSKLTIQEFSSKIKTKYPQYKDLPDDILVQKMVGKYPQYANSIEGFTQESTPVAEEGLAIQGFQGSTQKAETTVQEPSTSKYKISDPYSPEDRETDVKDKSVWNHLKKTVVNTLGYQLPSAGASTASAGVGAFEDFAFRLPEAGSLSVYKNIRGQEALAAEAKQRIQKVYGFVQNRNSAYDRGEISDEQYVEDIMKAREEYNFLTNYAPEYKAKGQRKLQEDLVKYAIKQQQKGAEYTKHLVKTIGDVEDPIDALNYAVGAVGETAAQILPGVATGGASLFVQEIGGIYTDQVRSAAEKNGITVEEVIARNLDNPGASAAFGMAAGLMENIGAKAVMNNITQGSLKSALRERVIKLAASGNMEGVTEAMQSILEQTGVNVANEESLANIDYQDILESYLKGAIGGGGMSASGQVASDVRSLFEKDGKEIKSPREKILDGKPKDIVDGSTKEEATIKRTADEITQDLDTFMNSEISEFDDFSDSLAVELTGDEIETPAQGDPVLNILDANNKTVSEATSDLGIVSKYEDIFSWGSDNEIRIVVDEELESGYGAFNRTDPNTIRLSSKLLKDAPKSLVDQVIAHETVHAMVDRALRTPESRNSIYKDLSALKSKYLDKTSLEGAPQGVIDMMTAIQDPKNLGEMIAYSLSNPEVAKWMDTIEVARVKGEETKTLWGRIKEAIRVLAGSIGVNSSALDKVNEILDNYANLEAKISPVEETSIEADVTTQQDQEVQPEATEMAQETQVEETIDDDQTRETIDDLVDMLGGAIEPDTDIDTQIDQELDQDIVESPTQVQAVDEDITPELKQERDEMISDLQDQAAKFNRVSGPSSKKFMESKLDRMIGEYNQFAEQQGLNPLSEQQISQLKETGLIQQETQQDQDFDLPEEMLMKGPESTVKKIVDIANKAPKMSKAQFSSFIARANDRLPEGKKISPEDTDAAWTAYSEQTGDDQLGSLRTQLLSITDPKRYKTKGGKFPKGKTVDPDTIDKLSEINSVMTGMSRDQAIKEAQDIMSNVMAKKGEGPNAKIEHNDLSDAERDRIELLNFAGVNEMDQQQLNDAISEVQSLINDGKTRYKKRREQEKQLIDSIKESIISVISGGKGVAQDRTEVRLAIEAKAKGKISAMYSDFFNMMESFDSLLDKLSVLDKGSEAFESDLNRIIGDMVQEAQQKENQGKIDISNEVTNKVKEIFGDSARKELVSNKTEKVDYNFIDRNGEVRILNMTPNQAYKRWMEAQDPSLDKTFEKDGFDRQELSNELEKQLDPRLIEWAKWQLNEFYPRYYDSINSVFREQYGFNLPKNEFYSPIERETDAKDVNLMEFSSPIETALNASLYSRKNNNKSLKPLDGDEVLASYIAKMEHFKAWNKPVSIMRKTLMSDDVRRTIALNHGKSFNKVVTSFINDFASGGVNRELAVKWMDKIRANYSTAVLGLNFPVFLKQLTSIPAYMAEIPVSAFGKGLADFAKNPKLAIDTLSNTAFMKERSAGGHDRDVRIAMGRDAQKTLLGKRNWRDQIMFLTRWGDAAAIYAGGWSVYKHHYDKAIRDGKSKEMAKKIAEQRFIKATRMSQQSSNTGDLSMYQRGGTFAKLFTMFMTSPMQYFRHTSTALRNLRAGRGSKQQNIKRLVVYNFILPTIFSMTSAGFRGILGIGDMDDEEKEALYGRYISQSIMGSLNGMYFVGPMIENSMMMMLGENFNFNASPLDAIGGDAASALASLGGVVNEIFEDGEADIESIYKAADEMSDLAGKVTGVPIPAVKRHSESVYHAVMDDDSGLWERFLLGLGYSKYAVGEKD